MAPVKVVQPRVSYADLERAPEDGRRYELYDGEVFVVPAPLPRHQISQQLVLEVLRNYAARHGGFAVDSPIDIVFSDYDVLQPDVVFFRRQRRACRRRVPLANHRRTDVQRGGSIRRLTASRSGHYGREAEAGTPLRSG